VADIADVVATLVSGVIVLDPEGTIVSANPAAAALGFTIGAHFTLGADQLIGNRIIASLASSMASVGSTVVALHDVTDRTIAAHRAELAEYRTEYSSTAASIAHQINNPLGIINIHAELIRDDVISLRARHREDAKLYNNISESLEELEAAIAAISQITANMRAFAQPMPSATHQLRRAIDWAVHVAAPDLRDRAFAVTEFNFDAAVAMTEPDLGRMLVHLLRNAGHSIPLGDAPNHQVTVTTRAAADPDRAIVEIRDTGAGISASRLATIFEPALTQRDGGAHVGLGLSECRAIARSVGGDITIESVAGSGTVVTIELPLR